MIKTVQDETQDLTLIEASGKLQLDEIVSVIEIFNSTGISGKVLWNLSDATVNHLRADEVRQVSTSIGDRYREGYQIHTAMVFSSKAAFGLGRMFEAFADIEKIPIVIKNFLSLQEAADWLEIEIPKI